MCKLLVTLSSKQLTSSGHDTIAEYQRFRKILTLPQIPKNPTKSFTTSQLILNTALSLHYFNPQ